ncbi:MAG: hypothetical protein NTZ34_00185 [Chloroflexi bacterium]|nr:hypothetical protein [Chloroflexota bacterium]
MTSHRVIQQWSDWPALAGRRYSSNFTTSVYALVIKGARPLNRLRGSIIRAAIGMK